MKKILITGSNSYIGMSFEKWLGKYPEKYSVDTVDMRSDDWKTNDFSKYDVVFHVAGIAHVSSKTKMEKLYYKVNRDLTIETAEKAKNQGVKQFILMSSIIVYGDSVESVINMSTIPNPSNSYGISKLQAEEGINALGCDSFKIVNVRPPMIYGKGSKGNYRKLAKVASKLPVFPDIHNRRSMLHIDNLCEFIRLIIDNKENGIFFPQNSEYVQTSEMVRLISEVHGKQIRLVKNFNGILGLLGVTVTMVNKVFGNLVYDMEMSSYKDNYRIRNFRESIRMTENSD